MFRYILKVDENFEENCDALKERLAALEPIEDEEQLVVRQDEIAAAIPATSRKSHIMNVLPRRLSALFF